MEIIETFGHYVENLTDKKPQSARRLLKTGWEAQNLKFRYMQDKRLMPADRHLANLMMDTMLWPLQKPEDSVIVSIFTPCEMMQEVGLHPYNVEGFSCYLSASKAERAFLQQAENQGIAETLCSYHKTFLGAAQKGLLPKPKCIVYTNLTCDANLLTFRTLADFYQVPVFAIDVPWNQTTENVQYVADQLKDLKIFLEKNTGKTISEDRLKERLACSKRTLENYKKYQQMRADSAVWFGHWGCKHTLGAAQLAKKKFEEAGLPLLILDGDGCDRSHGGEGQTSTRLGAFLEMLGGAENE